MPRVNPARKALSDQTNCLNMKQVRRNKGAASKPPKTRNIARKHQHQVKNVVKLKDLKVVLTDIMRKKPAVKQLNVVLSDICATKPVPEKPKKSLSVHLTDIFLQPVKNLRKLEPINYEESLIESPTPAKKGPIYKQPLPEPKITNDMYEFIDSSPKPKPKKRHRSTMFDKNTHEVVKKLEQKTKRAGKNKKPTSYDNKVKNIVENVKNKIKQRLEQPKVNVIQDVIVTPPTPQPPSPVDLEQSIDDIDHCFGFNEEQIPSPYDFGVTKPIANSTMLMPLSPWRSNLKMKSNTIRVKKNSLPSIGQDLVLDHTICDKFVGKPTKSKPIRKEAVQQSILDYIDSNVEVDKENLQGSLYDYEAFESPKKKRAPLQDIGNLNVTCFGFDSNHSSTPVKLQQENEPPWRVDVNLLKKYVKKNKDVVPLPDKSISIMETSKEEEHHLFEDPEEMLDRMSPVSPSKKRRKRLMSDDSPLEVRKKKHKKTEFDVQQEEWIARFNEECQEIDQSTLEVE